MSKSHSLRAQLSIAQQSSADADGAWRVAMAHHERPENEGSEDLGETAVIADAWQRRERRHRDVVELEHRLVQEHTGLVAQARAIWRRRPAQRRRAGLHQD